MPTYLEIAVNLAPVGGVYHYHLPPELDGQVAAGHLVIVPFGKQQVQGVVLQQVAQPEVPETKPVLALVDPDVALTPSQLALARRLSEINLAPLSACIGLMVPAGLSQVADTLYQSNRSSRTEWPASLALKPLQLRLLDLLEARGALRGRQIDQFLPRLNWRPAAQRLARHGLITTQPVLPPPAVHVKSVRTAQLACQPETAEAEMPNLGRAGSEALRRRQAMLRYLIRETGPVAVSWVYAASGGDLADLRYLAERNLVILGEHETWRDPLAELTFGLKEAPQLTGDQESAWAAIRAGIWEAAAGRLVAAYLLHGVTGSGKTEVYLRAVEESLRLEKQAIVLVPEIALTPQTVQRFVARFPGRVGLVHSQLSAGERYDTWRRARQGHLAVVIGPRSALFTPFSRLGLIVVDECHDDTYYQSDYLPHYHARETAVAYARLANAVCLMGSATPDVVSQYQAQQGHYQYLRLPARILAHRQSVQNQLELARRPEKDQRRYRPLEKDALTGDLPPVRVVDMRQELKTGNRSIFSRALQEALSHTLEAGEQAILFLNRRGTATYVFCRDCGFVLKCPRCNIPLTFHEVAQLTCHHCGYRRQMPPRCPECHSARIRKYGTGTERVEAEVQALFPQAKTLRWDYETTRQKGAHEAILSHFANHRADVLVGTQMLAKGLDLPLVTLVGVVLADVGLNLPDYRAPERTFQVLTQVAGRAGRSPLGGEVILQTFDPRHYVIQAAAEHDYAAFYHQEMKHRQELGYPPFTQLVRLEFRHFQMEQAEIAAQEMAEKIQGWLESGEHRATQMIGPAPCYYARINGQYRWQIVLRGPDPAALLRNRSLGEWRVEVNPASLL